ncbi:MAG: prepilin-type N-terminal cleavage/methylation domain-containing protein [Candidatus Pacebacteria bacterium]|nr:prepilin-type N-terminal cleavage/methylation domain-containing protein [Candidatus Paceibacterota bacterium]PIR59752.1 MAG: hypothetical protein COU68_03910 [Candidatus Pacebacteria bacterium CG10_big_fil_rev_8_21_14_0_10_45_6]
MRKGFSLIEVLIIVAILGLLLIAGYFFMAPQISRGRDSKRLSDLSKLKVVFEDYYNDHSCYPPTDTLELYCGGGGSTILDDYIGSVPCDPLTKGPYLYSVLGGDAPACPVLGYRILTDLERDHSDASIAINCGGENGCGIVDGEVIYDYGVAQGAAVSLEGLVLGLGGVAEGEGGAEGGGEPGPGLDWCCVLSNQSCTEIINGFPNTCNRDYHGANSQGACIANCYN